MVEYKEIDARSKSVREILDKGKYFVDYFQREYRWQEKHIKQLIDDLATKFLANYKEGDERRDIQKYDKYYLGPIVMLHQENGKSIIDGQQRLTSLTLLLIYLNNLQSDRKNRVNIDDLIFSERYGEKSFNLDVPERREVLERLYNDDEEVDDLLGDDESVDNILYRYWDIEEYFPERLSGELLPYFIDWLIDNVIFVEITTYSENDAYTIFETMNDRGLNLTPTEMLKGYILSKIKDENKKKEVDKIWREKVYSLKKISRNEDLEFFKAWLRAKYANTNKSDEHGLIEDFEKIGTRFHQWVRNNKQAIGLNSSENYYKFIKRDMTHFLKVYLLINKAARKYSQELDSIYHVAYIGLAPSIYYPLLMAPIKQNDNLDLIKKKLLITARYLEYFLVVRLINFRSISRSNISDHMYSMIKDIRNLDLGKLRIVLKRKFNKLKVRNYEDYDLINFEGIHRFRLFPRYRKIIQFILARITAFIETNCGYSNKLEEYLSKDIKKPYQIEHIWADKFEEHKDEFDQKEDFRIWRNSIGALLLLPEGSNQSYGALPYEDKLQYYLKENMFARSLHPANYVRNPNFLRFIKKYKLPFKPHPHFKTKDIEDREKLIKKILLKIYNTKMFES